jgi:hypothetical protein
MRATRWNSRAVALGINDLSGIGGELLAFFEVFVFNHAEYIRQFGESFFTRLHQSIASRNRRDFGYPRSIFLAIENYFVIFHAHNRSEYIPRCRLWLSSLCPLQLFGQRGHDLENITDDAVIRDFEDRRVLIFIDGDDRARAFHSDYVLDRTADAQCQI